MIRIKKKKVNPTDSEFIKNLRVEKFKLNNLYAEQYRYNVMYKDPVDGFLDYVGGAFYDAENKYVLKVEINPYFQRKGAATYLYDHIEKDMGIKLKSSGTLRPDGEKFWQNRLKKQNPTDNSLLSKIQIQKELIKIPKDKFRPRNTYYTEYQILLNGKIIGKAQIKKNKNYISWIEIDKNFQRKGLSSFLYDYIENDLGIKLKPSPNQLDEGKAFWKSRK